MPENWKLANAAISTCRCVSVMLSPDAKYTKELADAGAENDALVMMLPLVVVGCTSKQSVSQCEATASGVDNAASPDWQTPLEHGFTREADHYAKTTGRNPEVY